MPMRFQFSAQAALDRVISRREMLSRNLTEYSRHRDESRKQRDSAAGALQVARFRAAQRERALQIQGDVGVSATGLRESLALVEAAEAEIIAAQRELAQKEQDLRFALERRETCRRLLEKTMQQAEALRSYRDEAWRRFNRKIAAREEKQRDELPQSR